MYHTAETDECWFNLKSWKIPVIITLEWNLNKDYIYTLNWTLCGEPPQLPVFVLKAADVFKFKLGNIIWPIL